MKKLTKALSELVILAERQTSDGQTARDLEVIIWDEILKESKRQSAKYSKLNNDYQEVLHIINLKK